MQQGPQADRTGDQPSAPAPAEAHGAPGQPAEDVPARRSWSIRKLWSGLKRGEKIAVAIGLGLVEAGSGLLLKRYLEHTPAAASATASAQGPVIPTDQPSIAVLPFDNMTGDPQQGFFADGFTEQIITSLSKIPSVSVVARNSSFTYKGKPVKVQQVSQELGVRYVLEGSVQKMSSRLRINVQLIDATSGKHVWAESFDREMGDVFALQDELILKILTGLNVNLTYGDRARAWAQGTKNVEAYLKTMQVREHMRRWNHESIGMARREAQEAIALDPQYAEAYAMLGGTYLLDIWLRRGRPEENIASADKWAQKALALDPSSPGAHNLMAWLYMFTGRHDDAVAAAERAVELEPTSGDASFQLAGTLKYAGRPLEAIPANQKALRLEPIPPDLWVSTLALLQFQAGHCKEATATTDGVPLRNPDNMNSRVMMTIVYAACGRESDARKQAAEVLRINPKFVVASYMAVLPYKNQSDKDRIAEALRKAGLP